MPLSPRDAEGQLRRTRIASIPWVAAAARPCAWEPHRSAGGGARAPALSVGGGVAAVLLNGCQRLHHTASGALIVVFRYACVEASKSSCCVVALEADSPGWTMIISMRRRRTIALS